MGIVEGSNGLLGRSVGVEEIVLESKEKYDNSEGIK